MNTLNRRLGLLHRRRIDAYLSPWEGTLRAIGRRGKCSYGEARAVFAGIVEVALAQPVDAAGCIDFEAFAWEVAERFGSIGITFDALMAAAPREDAEGQVWE